MTALSENSIVINPRKELTRTRQDAVKAIAFFRRQRKTGRRWLVGDKRISEKMVSSLERLDLVGENQVGGQSTLKLTMAGNMVAERLSQ